MAHTPQFQFKFWSGGAFESLVISGIRRVRGDAWRGAFFESLHFALSGVTARNMLFALFESLYITLVLVFNFRETHTVRFSRVSAHAAVLPYLQHKNDVRPLAAR